MKQTLLKIYTIIAILSLITFPVHALTTQASLKIDRSITRIDNAFTLPTQIILSPIFSETVSKKVTEDMKFKGLFYYTIDKLGFPDIPYHYVVSQSGTVFEGNIGGDERQVSISGVGDRVIFVGYMTDRSNNTFDERAKLPITDLLVEIANRNSVNPDNIKLNGTKFVKNLTTNTVTIETEEIFGSWNVDVINIINAVKSRYAPTEKTYSVEVTQVIIPTEEVVPGEEVIGSIKIKNTTKYGIYPGTVNELLLTKTAGDSKFFINNLWPSRSQIKIMQENQPLLPNQEATLDFKLKAPIIFGRVNEQFSIKTTSGGSVSVTPFEIGLNIKRTDKRVVEILNTELGYLRVRSEPSTVGTEVSQVTPGERFIVIEDAGNGYLKIDLGNGTSGWVAGWFTQDV